MAAVGAVLAAGQADALRRQLEIALWWGLGAILAATIYSLPPAMIGPLLMLAALARGVAFAHEPQRAIGLDTAHVAGWWAGSFAWLAPTWARYDPQASTPWIWLWLGLAVALLAGVHHGVLRLVLRRRTWLPLCMAPTLASLVTFAPPLGWIAWGHPLHGAGYVFSGWGLWGVLAMAVLGGAIIAAVARLRLAELVLASITGAIATAHGGAEATQRLRLPPPEGIVPISLHLDTYRHWSLGEKIAFAAEQVGRINGPIVHILPEGYLMHPKDALMTAFLRGRAEASGMGFLLGFTAPNDRHNGAIWIDAATERVLPSRIPVPMVGWQGYALRPFQPVATVETTRGKLSIAICYEETLIDHWLLMPRDATPVTLARWWMLSPAARERHRRIADGMYLLFGHVPVRAVFW